MWEPPGCLVTLRGVTWNGPHPPVLNGKITGTQCAKSMLLLVTSRELLSKSELWTLCKLADSEGAVFPTVIFNAFNCILFLGGKF